MVNTIVEMARALPPWAILGFGLITGSLRSAWAFPYEHTIGYAMTRVSLSMTVEDLEHREAYLWLSQWVEKNLHKRRINSLLLRKPEDDDAACSRQNPRFRLIPDYGTYYMKYKKRLMVVEHRKESPPDTPRAQPTHSLRLQLWLVWDRKVIFDILHQARNAYEESQPPTIRYFRTDQYGEWDEQAVSPRVLPEMTGERLADLLSKCRKPALIALEDVDCLEVATSRKSKSSEGLTTADLLNVIDGIGASEDRVLFMTANHPESLDPALTRAGRVDRKFYIDYARDEELRSFHTRISEHYPVQPWPEFRAALPQQATIADAQALAGIDRIN